MTVIARFDTFARQQKRRWVAEARRQVKTISHAGARTSVRLRTQAMKAWERRTRRAAHVAEMRQRKGRRALKIAMERLRNAPVLLRNLSRKTMVYAKGLRRPWVRWRVRRARFEEKVVALRAESGIEREIQRIADRGDAIVVGPWLSEVGYEALYWVPFVRWFRATYRIKPDRMLVLTRGGAAAWYADVTTNHVELFDLVTPDEINTYNTSRMEVPGGTIKQLEVTPFERDLVERARASWGMRRVQVLHPSLMYRLFQQFWAGNRALSFLDEFAMYRSIDPPATALPSGLDLPADYVAMKLYTAQSLQDSPHTREILRGLIAAVAERWPVVLLDTGLALDDHDDYRFAPAHRVVSAREWMTARDNLAIQTRIVAGARSFVGTCGSIAWLAPMLGVDTTALMTDDKALTVHLQVARRVYRVLNRGRFAPLDLGAFESLGLTVTGTRDAVLGRP